MTYIKVRQAGAVREHITHIHHICSIEMAYIKVRQAVAGEEHTSHTSHISGVEIVDARDGHKVAAFVEPIRCTCNFCTCSHRFVKGNHSNVTRELIPSTRSITIEWSNTHTSTSFHLVIIIER